MGRNVVGLHCIVEKRMVEGCEVGGKEREKERLVWLRWVEWIRRAESIEYL